MRKEETIKMFNEAFYELGYAFNPNNLDQEAFKKAATETINKADSIYLALELINYYATLLGNWKKVNKFIAKTPELFSNYKSDTPRKVDMIKKDEKILDKYIATNGISKQQEMFFFNEKYENNHCIIKLKSSFSRLHFDEGNYTSFPQVITSSKKGKIKDKNKKLVCQMVMKKGTNEFTFKKSKNNTKYLIVPYNNINYVFLKEYALNNQHVDTDEAIATITFTPLLDKPFGISLLNILKDGEDVELLLHFLALTNSIYTNSIRRRQMLQAAINGAAAGAGS